MARVFFNYEMDEYVYENEILDAYCEALKKDPYSYRTTSFEDFISNCLDVNGGDLIELKATMETKLRDYYMRVFPADDLGEDLNATATFQDLIKALICHRDVYEVFGVGDSIIRERMFAQLSFILDCEYDDIYRLWLK